MKLAIMQPYLFPYIGYFQLIHAVDKFVFYDDVSFIKGGWINRNKIKVNDAPFMFTLPLSGASSNKLIKDIKIQNLHVWKRKFMNTLLGNYKKAPYYFETCELLNSLFSEEVESLCDLIIRSNTQISRYLGLDTEFSVSSQSFSSTNHYQRAERLIEICKLANSDTYINMPGGKELYAKPFFENRGVELLFIEPNLAEYYQNGSFFIPGLSIIDVLMNVSIEEINRHLKNYVLV